MGTGSITTDRGEEGFLLFLNVVYFLVLFIDESRQKFSTGQSVPFSKYKSTFLKENGPFLAEKDTFLKQKSMKKRPSLSKGHFCGPFFASKRYFETSPFHIQNGSFPVTSNSFDFKGLPFVF